MLSMIYKQKQNKKTEQVSEEVNEENQIHQSAVVFIQHNGLQNQCEKGKAFADRTTVSKQRYQRQACFIKIKHQSTASFPWGRGCHSIPFIFFTAHNSPAGIFFIVTQLVRPENTTETSCTCRLSPCITAGKYTLTQRADHSNREKNKVTARTVQRNQK